jgi:hypothetical protein
MITEITNRAELEKWLRERNWLRISQLSDVSTVSKSSASDDQSQTGSFDLSQMITGGCWAGEEQTFEQLRVTAFGVTVWEYSNLETLLNYCFEDIAIPEGTGQLNLCIDDNFTIECRQITVERLGPRISTVAPELSVREAHVTFQSQDFIKPSEWIDMFKGVGLSVEFRRLGDVAISADEVPIEYNGWFLQLSNRVGDTQYGLMFGNPTLKDENFSVSFDMWSPDDDYAQPLWSALRRITAKLSNASVRCGNCRLTGAEWLLAQENGEDWLKEHFGAKR